MTEKPDNQESQRSEDLSGHVDDLANQVKVLALNLAITLAKEKDGAKELACLEPEFTRLIHGSVEVIKEVALIVRTARNENKMIFSPSSESGKLDRIDTALNEILSLSQSLLKTIAEIKKRRGMVDKYR